MSTYKHAEVTAKQREESNKKVSKRRSHRLETIMLSREEYTEGYLKIEERSERFKIDGDNVSRGGSGFILTGLGVFSFPRATWEREKKVS